MQRLLPCALLSVCLCPAAFAQQATVHFRIDSTQDVRLISRCIYGVNQPIQDSWNATLTRLGGNRWTAYNWVTNASNAGNDWHYQSDDFLGGGDTPGGAMIPGIENAYKHNAGIILTVPMCGYVSADKKGDGDIRKSPDYMHTRLKKEVATKGAPFTLTPDPNEPVVYEDEFVNWVKTKYPYGETDPTRPIWFSLDNEPDLWSSTHAETHPEPLTYAELISKSIEYATSIKNVEPKALVFGAINYGWGGYVTLQNSPDANHRDFHEVFLAAMAKAEKQAGRRLIDSLDVHWYPEARGGNVRVTEPDTTPEVVKARLQAPRSLWDPTYTEDSWIVKASAHGPIRLIPRLQEKIDRNYPGTKLSFSEYNYGGGKHISGGIAEADVLGIFGKEGVFAANEWPGADKEPFVYGGLRMYRNFDGKNGTFGDTSVRASTDDIEATSVYASVDSQKKDQLVVVAINKTDHPISAEMSIGDGYQKGEVYRLTQESADPQAGDAIKVGEAGKAEYTMPAYSVSTIRFTKAE